MEMYSEYKCHEIAAFFFIVDEDLYMKHNKTLHILLTRYEFIEVYLLKNFHYGIKGHLQDDFLRNKSCAFSPTGL